MVTVRVEDPEQCQGHVGNVCCRHIDLLVLNSADLSGGGVHQQGMHGACGDCAVWTDICVSKGQGQC